MREILWTERSEDHIARHNVKPGEVEEALNGRPHLLLKGKESVIYHFGTTDAGRFLMIVLTDAVDGRYYVATARDMTREERRVFRRKGK